MRWRPGRNSLPAMSDRQQDRMHDCDDRTAYDQSSWRSNPSRCSSEQKTDQGAGSAESKSAPSLRCVHDIEALTRESGDLHRARSLPRSPQAALAPFSTERFHRPPYPGSRQPSPPTIRSRDPASGERSAGRRCRTERRQSQATCPKECHAGYEFGIESGTRELYFYSGSHLGSYGHALPWARGRECADTGPIPPRRMLRPLLVSSGVRFGLPAAQFVARAVRPRIICPGVGGEDLIDSPVLDVSRQQRELRPRLQFPQVSTIRARRRWSPRPPAA